MYTRGVGGFGVGNGNAKFKICYQQRYIKRAYASQLD